MRICLIFEYMIIYIAVCMNNKMNAQSIIIIMFSKTNPYSNRIFELNVTLRKYSKKYIYIY